MANLNYAKALVGGHIATDVEVRTTPNGVNVTSFTIAVNRKNEKNVVDFIRCVAWRGTADNLAKYFKKGSSIFVTGTLQVREYEKDGRKTSTTEILVDEFAFVDSKSESSETMTPVTDEALPF